MPNSKSNLLIKTQRKQIPIIFVILQSILLINLIFVIDQSTIMLLLNIAQQDCNSCNYKQKPVNKKTWNLLLKEKTHQEHILTLIFKQQKSKSPLILYRGKIEYKINFNIKEDFLHLDRYNFEQFYFEFLAILICHNVTSFQKCLLRCHISFQQGRYSDNRIFKKFNQLTGNLGYYFENIKLDFQQFQFNNLTILKMILKKCQFEKDKLQKILLSLNSRSIQVVYIDLSQCDQRFTTQEQTELSRNLERKRIYVFIKTWFIKIIKTQLFYIIYFLCLLLRLISLASTMKTSLSTILITINIGVYRKDSIYKTAEFVSIQSKYIFFTVYIRFGWNNMKIHIIFLGQGMLSFLKFIL
ncbi:unnamed protein product [Paramecium octaurelia]|uniref:Transmembrane protein n=1 Tax=Paramecium octaurelia TaxID=43137 RepID=A0A8S1YCZ0_PAROT|nr:unnamed protein product [Paramecium octaurelia]